MNLVRLADIEVLAQALYLKQSPFACVLAWDEVSTATRNHFMFEGERNLLILERALGIGE